MEWYPKYRLVDLMVKNRKEEHFSGEKILKILTVFVVFKVYNNFVSATELAH